jgi:hypothetical protein
MVWLNNLDFMRGGLNFYLVVILGTSILSVEDWLPRFPVAKSNAPPTTTTINMPTKTPSIPTPPLLSAMIVSLVKLVTYLLISLRILEVQIAFPAVSHPAGLMRVHRQKNQL